MTTQITPWAEHEVRLFPSVHVSSEREAELRATASLLATMRAVSEFGRTIVKLAGGPAGRLCCFTEVPFQLGKGTGQAPEYLRPDGVLTVERGKTRWDALVEVKVGTANLEQDQVDRYHRLAKQERLQALITVSNQPAQANGSPPVNVDGRRSIPVVHFSWERLLSEAQVLSRKKEVSDSDQKWMLDEWIRYVEDPDSRIIVAPDLGSKWGDVLGAARTNALSPSSPELQDVARSWVGYLRKAALRLRAKLGVEVEVRMSRSEREDSELQARNVVNAKEGTLTGILRVPDAAGDITIKVILPSQSVQYILQVAAPTEGRQATRVNWLSRQLREDRLPTGELAVTADWTIRGLITTVGARDFLEDTNRLCLDKAGASVPRDANPRSFQVVWTRALSKSRGRSSAPVLKGISDGLEEFYHGVVQDIVPFVPKAPRLDTKKPEGEAASQYSVGAGPATGDVVPGHELIELTQQDPTAAESSFAQSDTPTLSPNADE
ncbi:hypothetical protein [Candidatus Methylomirabilis sp.]|uniref:hypothetical protein n=1 Tax=Candidatus Methylomirabilis sp. TaxID=2032687 RepID=UPI00307654EC